MCKSRTGSGKTLAFAIPIIEALERQSGGEAAVQMQRGGRGRHFKMGAYGRLPRAICVAPTRELAKQVIYFKTAHDSAGSGCLRDPVGLVGCSLRVDVFLHVMLLSWLLVGCGLAAWEA